MLPATQQHQHQHQHQCLSCSPRQSKGNGWGSICRQNVELWYFRLIECCGVYEVALDEPNISNTLTTVGVLNEGGGG
jgi:hypothetical protein